MYYYHKFAFEEDEYGVSYSISGNDLILLNCKNEAKEALNKYSIRDGTRVICDDAFDGRYGRRGIKLRISPLSKLIIPDSVKQIGEGAFSFCEYLQAINIPDSVISIGDRAFFGCKSLRQINIPSRVLLIGQKMFEECIALQQIDIPDNVIEIGDNAFCGCSSLRKVIIPDSVISIGNCAFYGCKSLKQVVLSNSVNWIGRDAFCGCSSLQYIVIPSGKIDRFKELIVKNLWCKIVESSDSEMSENSNIKMIIENGKLIAYDGTEKYLIIPNSCSVIGERAFSYNDSLRHVFIPDSVRRIESGAFLGCNSLQRVFISESVKDIHYVIFNGCESIGDYAFSGCRSLKSINLPNSIIKIGKGVFDGCDCLQQIVIPKWSTEVYKQKLTINLWDKLVQFSERSFISPSLRRFLFQDRASCDVSDVSYEDGLRELLDDQMDAYWNID